MLVGSVAVLGAVGSGVVGFSPHVVNTVRHGRPVHPLRGADAHDISSLDLPVNLHPHNRVMRFVIATVSQTANVNPAKGTQLKWPFTVHRSEVFEHLTAGGFGPLYGGALLLALVVRGRAIASPSGVGWSRERVVLVTIGGLLVSMSCTPRRGGFDTRRRPG